MFERVTCLQGVYDSLSTDFDALDSEIRELRALPSRDKEESGSIPDQILSLQARADKIRDELAAVKSLLGGKSDETLRVSVGTIVVLKDRRGTVWYAILGVAPGLKVAVGDNIVTVITPRVPVARELLGKKVGDYVEVTDRNFKVHAIY